MDILIYLIAGAVAVWLCIKFAKVIFYVFGFCVLIGIGSLVIGGSDYEDKKAKNVALQTSYTPEVVEPPKPKKKTWSEKWDEASVENDTRKMASLIMDGGETFEADMLCSKVLRQSAKYPNKVDFNWFSGNGATKLYYTNGTPERQGLYKVIKSGEAMNGFGNMIPFTGICEFSVNINNKTLDLADAYWGSKKIY